MLRIFSRQTDIDRFDMTPIIDIVFLLIIFFLLVCQFIVAENFDVTVPDDISSAQPAPADQQMTTVTVMPADAGGALYAVGSEIIAAPSGRDISYAIAGEIDTQLQHLPRERRVVCLRIDKDICFRDSQYALAGISRSTATDMKLAVTKQKLAK